MGYLFDASAIFSAIGLGASEKLIGNYTITLARYELGNTVLKEGLVFKRLTANEQKRILAVIDDTLRQMQVLDIEDALIGILETATAQKLSFYDASYIYLAKLLKIPLVTEDLRLAEKVKPYIATFRTSEI